MECCVSSGRRDMSVSYFGDYQQLQTYFETKNYQQYETNEENFRLYTTYQKSSYYLINLLYIRDEHRLDVHEYKKYTQKIAKQFQTFPADHIIVLNIFVGHWSEKVYEAYSEQPNMEERIIEVSWFIHSEQKELRIPKKQLNSVIGIEKDIKRLLKKETQHYYDSKKEKDTYYITLILCGVNLIIWWLMERNGGSTNLKVLMEFGAQQVEYMQKTNEYWRLFTSMFLHIGVGHLFFNLFSLYIFGSRLEKYVSTQYFLLIYLGAGLIGSGVSYFVQLWTNPYIVSAGASGAIYGLIGAILVYSKAMHKPLDGLNSYVIWLVFIYGIAYSVLSPNVGIYAHIGGFFGGIGISIPIVRLRRQKIGGNLDENG